jgi:hypothetical protein
LVGLCAAVAPALSLMLSHWPSREGLPGKDMP